MPISRRSVIGGSAALVALSSYLFLSQSSVSAGTPAFVFSTFSDDPLPRIQAPKGSRLNSHFTTPLAYTCVHPRALY